MPETQIQVKLNPDVNPSGSDLAVVNAARRSFNTRSDWDWTQPEGLPVGASYKPKLKEKDKRLIQFLARGMTADDFDTFLNNIESLAEGVMINYDRAEYEAESTLEKSLVDKLWQWRNTPTHDTPFNHCFISFEVKAPIFVSRQLVKHEYLIMSEFSRRYITNEIEFYTPDTWRGKAENKKQGSADWSVPYSTIPAQVRTDYNEWEGSIFTDHTEVSLDLYNNLINSNIAPEQARMVLPQSTMTEWTWSGTLGAFAKMCQLRLHQEAQYESRLVARQVYDYLLQFYPVSAKALVEGADV